MNITLYNIKKYTLNIFTVISCWIIGSNLHSFFSEDIHPVFLLTFILFICLSYIISKEITLYIYFSLLYLLPLLIQELNFPAQSIYITWVFTFLFFAETLFRLILKKQTVFFPHQYEILVIFIVVVLSTLFSRNNPYIVSKYAYQYFHPMAFFFFLLNANLSQATLNRLFRFVTSFAFIEIVFSVGKKIILPNLPGGDFYGGTFGETGTGVLGVFLVMIGCYCIGKLYLIKSKLRYYVYFLVIMVIASFADIKALFFMVPGVFCVEYLFSGKATKKMSFILVVSLVLFFFAFQFISDYMIEHRLASAKTFQSIASPKRMIEYLFLKNRVNESSKHARLAGMEWTFKEIASRDWNKVFFGFGPGSMKDSKYFNISTAMNYFKKMVGGSSAVTVTLIDLGFGGLIAFTLLLIAIFRNSLTILFTENDPGRKALFLGFIGVIFSFFISLFYYSSLLSDITSITFWFFYGYILLMNKNRESIPENVC